jgi:hypothetical protein
MHQMKTIDNYDKSYKLSKELNNLTKILVDSTTESVNLKSKLSNEIDRYELECESDSQVYFLIEKVTKVIIDY